METGLTVDDSVNEEFTKLRMKRTHRYLIIKVSDDKTKVEIEAIGERDSTFEQFKDAMPKDQCR